MAQTPRVIRFSPNGPEATGLEEWEAIDPAGLVEGEPVQRGHIYHQNEEAGYLTGVWDCTAFTAQMGPYGEDEFMLLLEGSLVMGLPDGTEVTINEGDAFVIPKGLECQWKQPGYVRKFFMILDGPVPAEAENVSIRRITVPDLGGELAGAGQAAPEVTRTDFVNAAGTMRVGVRQCGAARFPSLQVRENQLIHVLEGSLTITMDGATEDFVPGETAYIRQETEIGWQTEEGTRLLFSIWAGE